MARKKPCVDINNQLLCRKCGNKFANKQNLNRHQKKVCNKEKAVPELEIEKAKREAAEEMVEKLMGMISSQTTINNDNSTNTVNNIVNIQINDYGHEKEDHEYIKQNMELIGRCLRSGVQGDVLLIKNRHFHPDHPENNNIKMSNKKEKTFRVIKDKAWVPITRDIMVSDQYYFLVDTYAHFLHQKATVTKRDQNAYDRRVNRDDKEEFVPEIINLFSENS